jgi:hypothetical protein
MKCDEGHTDDYIYVLISCYQWTVIRVNVHYEYQIYSLDNICIR